MSDSLICGASSVMATEGHQSVFLGLDSVPTEEFSFNVFVSVVT